MEVFSDSPFQFVERARCRRGLKQRPTHVWAEDQKAAAKIGDQRILVAI
jgi:hypothetical protein